MNAYEMFRTRVTWIAFGAAIVACLVLAGRSLMVTRDSDSGAIAPVVPVATVSTATDAAAPHAMSHLEIVRLELLAPPEEKPITPVAADSTLLARWHVHVVDADTTRPLANVVVAEFEPDRESPAEWWAERTRYAATDSAGKTVVDIAVPGSAQHSRRCVLGVAPPWYGEKFEYDVTAGDHGNVVLFARRGMDVRGLVTTEDDTPIADAQVALMERSPTNARGGRLVARTDERGGFALAGISAASEIRSSIYATADEYLPSDEIELDPKWGGERDVTIRLRDAGVIVRGRIIADAGSVATITLWDRAGGRAPQRHAVIGSDGRFEFRNAPRRDLVLDIAGHCFDGKGGVDLRAAGDAVDLGDLAPHRSEVGVVVEVVDAAGRPFANAGRIFHRGREGALDDAGAALIHFCLGEPVALGVEISPSGLAGDAFHVRKTEPSWIGERRARITIEPQGVLVVLAAPIADDAATETWVKVSCGTFGQRTRLRAGAAALRVILPASGPDQAKVQVGRGDEVIFETTVNAIAARRGTVRVELPRDSESRDGR
jgi:hypothetical protein